MSNTQGILLLKGSATLFKRHVEDRVVIWMTALFYCFSPMIIKQKDFTIFVLLQRYALATALQGKAKKSGEKGN